MIWSRPARRSVALALLVLLAACGEHATAPPTVSDGTPEDPADYAAQAGSICDRALDGADDAIDIVDDVYDTDRARDALLEGAEELAALTPPEDRREIAQGLVESLTEHGDLVRSADDDPEEYSQDQNALELVISVQIAGLDASCPAVPDVLEPPRRPEDSLDEFSDVEFGDDPEADALAQRCFEGELAACDEVRSFEGYGGYGATCGERVYIEESNAWPDCVETFASEEPVRGQIVTEDESS